MRSSLKSLIAVAAAFMVAPSFASADVAGGGDDLQEVLSRMSDLEQQLKATNDALAASNAKVDQQQKMLSKLGTSNQSAPMLALSNFLTETTFEGWVSTSYFYNTNDPNRGESHEANTGPDDTWNRFHPHSNSFQVDQVWFSMSNQATPESRAGFDIDIVFGETSKQLSWGFDNDRPLGSLYNANVSYLAPITDAGIKVTAGLFEDHIGTEAVQDTRNFNITRGLLWSLQPVGFTGVKLSSEYDNGVNWMLGVSNNSGYHSQGLTHGHDYDMDEGKVFLWTVGYRASDELSVAFNGLYGSDCAQTGDTGGSVCGLGGHNTDRQILLDLTTNWDPSDKLSTWLNFDYMAPENDRRSGKPYVIGVAAAGRYSVTDATGVALRLEYIYSHDNYLGVGDVSPTTGFNEDQDVWSVTATLDHALTEHLTVKAEVVYQEGNSQDNTDNQYFCDSTCSDNALDRRQVLVGAQMTYEF